MGFTVTQRGPEVDAILARLNATANVLAGDGIRPAGGGFPKEDPTQVFAPYCVVSAGIVSQVDGPVADPFADTINEYQVTSVGATAAQARWMADLARTALVGQPLAVSGRSVNLFAPVSSQPTTRDDSTTPPLWFQADIYSITSSPA